jgi:hypothetical protein
MKTIKNEIVRSFVGGFANLDNEHRAGRDLHIVPEFEILQEAYSLRHTYIRIRFEANVCNRLARQNVAHHVLCNNIQARNLLHTHTQTLINCKNLVHVFCLLLLAKDTYIP